MQKILSFNVIFQGVNIILHNNFEIITARKFESDKQSEILVSSLEEVLKENNLSYKDIDIFSTITGPGNFTGIKTNLAVLKALQISTKAKFITNNLFEIISKDNHYEIEHDIIILSLQTAKYFIKDKKEYYTIYKKDLNEFIQNNKNTKIITNDINIKNPNVIYSDYSNKKLIDLINYKIQNNIFTKEIHPLYIEEAKITKRKK